MTFFQLLQLPMYAWDLEEIDSHRTGPTGHYTNSLCDHVDTVNDLMAYQMLAEHHQVVLEIRQYIQNNDNQWIIPRKPFI